MAGADENYSDDYSDVLSWTTRVPGWTPRPGTPLTAAEIAKNPQISIFAGPNAYAPVARTPRWFDGIRGDGTVFRGVGFYLDESQPSRGADFAFDGDGSDDLAKYALPQITPASGPLRGRVWGTPIRPRDWSRGIRGNAAADPKLGAVEPPTGKPNPDPTPAGGILDQIPALLAPLTRAAGTSAGDAAGKAAGDAAAASALAAIPAIAKAAGDAARAQVPPLVATAGQAAAPVVTPIAKQAGADAGKAAAGELKTEGWGLGAKLAAGGAAVAGALGLGWLLTRKKKRP